MSLLDAIDLLFKEDTQPARYSISRRPDAVYNEWAIRAGYPGGLARKSPKEGGAFGQSKEQKRIRDSRKWSKSK